MAERSEKAENLPIIREKDLGPADRNDLAYGVTVDRVKGYSYSDLARFHNITVDLAKKLVGEELDRRNRNRPDPRGMATAKYEEVQKVSWENIETNPVVKRSGQVLAMMLKNIVEAQKAIDDIEGNKAPKEVKQTTVNVAELLRQAEQQDDGSVVVTSEVIEELEGP